MTCSICKLEGHNKRSCKENIASVKNEVVQGESLTPSSADMYWLLYGKCGDNHGKWMLFHNRSKIDEEWKKIKKLYDESKLGNVISIKCSGAKENSRASNKNEHVIIIYCPDSETDIIDIGNKIIENLVDYSNQFIYYKSNIQTREGTKATGQLVNHLYKLPVKKQDYSCNRVGGLSRREMKNIVSKEGYCRCGRKDEEDRYGCSRYPSCINDLEDNAWY